MQLPEIKAEVERLAQIIGAPAGLLPTFGPSTLDEVPFVLHDADGYHLAFRERGHVDKTTYPDADALLFAIFASITQSMALHATRAQRFEEYGNRDDRRVWFAAQADLMRRLSPAWGEQEVERQRATLRDYPFDDDATARADLSKTYREQGYDNEVAWTMACARYPLPVT